LEIVQPPIEKDNPYFDKAIGNRTKLRKKSQFKFVSHGKYIQKAEKLRNEARLEALKLKISETIKKSGVDANLDLISEKSIRRDAPPLMEWWDLPLTHGFRTYEEFLGDDDSLEFDFTKPVPMEVDADGSKSATKPDDSEGLPPITIYIQHPVPIPPAFEAPPPPRQVMLTKKERQKLRRQRRMEEQREQQDKIRLGLLPPEQPKVRMANLARVLKNESVMDPTKVDAEVRQQVEARRIKHERINLERQLTVEQRRDKIQQRKLREEAKGISVAVFKCKDMSHPKIKFKINANVQQLGLTGIAVIHDDLHVIVVEGGARSIRHFKKLLLKRIHWTPGLHQGDLEEGSHNSIHRPEESESDNDDYLDPNHQNCWLLWEGQPPQRSFQGFRFKKCIADKQAYDLFYQAGAHQYWDLAKSWAPTRLF
jgi:U4/U6 small nuclear ribonucleoprotein PRP3